MKIKPVRFYIDKGLDKAVSAIFCISLNFGLPGIPSIWQTECFLSKNGLQLQEWAPTTSFACPYVTQYLNLDSNVFVT